MRPKTDQHNTPMFKYTLTIVAIPIVIQEVKEKYAPVIIILYLSIYELLPPQINKPTNGKIPTNEQSVAMKSMILKKQLEIHIYTHF